MPQAAPSLRPDCSFSTWSRAFGLRPLLLVPQRGVLVLKPGQAPA